ncbi:MAG: MalY/PatB family protein [Spirochaetia bacterium]|jgi:cystathionine beta-lyase|nr:MalY/PatB family protein [Spirochaetia bacterium]
MYDFNADIDRSKTDSVKWKLGASCASSTYPDVLPMWVADMDFASPPAIVEAMKRRSEHPIYGYSSKPIEFFDSYINWMKSRYGVSVDARWLSFSPGIVPAIATAIRAFTDRGDGVVITPPVYHPFKQLIESNRRTVVEAPLALRNGRYEFDLQALDAACSKARLLVLCSPHNPVARVWNREELDAVAAITLRHKVLVIADEIHGDLVFKHHRMVPSLSLDDEFKKRLIAAWAPSKTFNIAGLQASCVVIPDAALHAAFEQESAATGLGSPNCMIASAAVTAYASCGPWLDEALDHMWGNYEALVAGLAKKAAAIKVYPCEGTYLAWLDFRGVGLDGDVGAEIIDRAGLWLDAGVRFGTGGDGFARLNFACPRQHMDTAVARLSKAFG